jgi:hypothetical protein
MRANVGNLRNTGQSGSLEGFSWLLICLLPRSRLGTINLNGHPELLPFAIGLLCLGTMYSSSVVPLMKPLNDDLVT